MKILDNILYNKCMPFVNYKLFRPHPGLIYILIEQRSVNQHCLLLAKEILNDKNPQIFNFFGTNLYVKNLRDNLNLNTEPFQLAKEIEYKLDLLYFFEINRKAFINNYIYQKCFSESLDPETLDLTAFTDKEQLDLLLIKDLVEMEMFHAGSHNSRIRNKTNQFLDNDMLIKKYKQVLQIPHIPL